MNERANPERDRLTEGWPQEEGNDRLADFAERLAASLPELPASAMERIETALTREMESKPPPIRAWWVFFRKPLRAALATAAAVLLAAGAYLALRSGGIADPSGQPTPHATVSDAYAVAYAGVPAPPAPAKPLIATAEYRGLIEPARE